MSLLSLRVPRIHWTGSSTLILLRVDLNLSPDRMGLGSQTHTQRCGVPDQVPVFLKTNFFDFYFILDKIYWINLVFYISRCLQIYTPTGCYLEIYLCVCLTVIFWRYYKSINPFPSIVFHPSHTTGDTSLDIQIRTQWGFRLGVRS